MNTNKGNLWLLILSIGGVLFSGYLSANKLLTGTCAFNESCPYFLGYPACYFGFAMFAALFIFSLLLVLRRMGQMTGINAVSAVSFLGIIFAGYFTLKEFPILLQSGLGAYMLGLPTCAMGLIFFAIIFIITLNKKLRV